MTLFSHATCVVQVMSGIGSDMYQDADCSVQVQAKLFRPAQVASHQMAGFDDEETVTVKRIVGKCYFSAIQRAADNALEVGAALGGRVDDACRYILSDFIRFACGEDKNRTYHR